MEIRLAQTNKFLAYLAKPVSAAPLMVFKTVFGALLIISTVRFVGLGWIEDHYLSPQFHFKYWGFGFVEPISAFWLYSIHYLIILSALGIVLLGGISYRISAIVLFLTFTYTELIDMTYYLNHYYFVSCLCFILIFLPAKSGFLPAIRVGLFVPRWCILVLKIQISLVYVYAGLAKLNYDWLINALPLKIWLPAHDKIPVIGSIFTQNITPYVFSWAGMLYDCTIIFFLINRKTRFLAYLTVVVFHLLTGLLFQIGVFPLVMIGATLIFFDWPIIDKNWINASNQTQIAIPMVSLGLVLGTAYFLFQFIFPLRFLCYTNNLFWSEEGYRFSWRVMLMEKAGTATFYVKDPQSGRVGTVDNAEFLNLHQEKQMAIQPDMILQFAHFLGKYYQQKSKTPNIMPEIRVESYVTLNGRPSRLLINPTVDLMKQKDTFAQKTWITNFTTQ